MSEVLSAAAKALNAPEVIVQRSAEARAKATGTSVEEVLAAWAGGAPVAAPSEPSIQISVPSTQTEQPAAPEEPEPPEGEDEADSKVSPPSSVISPQQEPEAEGGRPEARGWTPEAEEVVAAASLRERVRLGGRVGAITGALLGVLGMLLGTPWLLPAASVVGDEGSYQAAVEVTSSRFIGAVILLSMVFGVVVATLSRGLTGWMGKGMALIGRYYTTVALGIALGAVLGAVAGGVLTSAFAQPLESAPEMVAITLLPAMIVLVIGGAVLGWITAVLVQAVGLPAGLDDEEVLTTLPVRRRLGSAIALPVGALIGLALFVLPLAVVLIRSNEMARGAASLVAVIAAGSVLAFAGLSASRPGMKISLGEFLMAIAGIGVIIVIIVAIFLARSAGREEDHAEEAAPAESAPTETSEGAEATLSFLVG